ncbi:MAG: tetratricopeptide repeat protein [Chloroflexi bacterium]|nr:MAG: tetratricopeptide repeat protein [Chloroflexota bacterium]
MSSNYSSDPNNAASISNPSTPQSDKAVSSVAPQPFSVSNSFSAEPDSPGSGGEVSSGSLRRLAAGTMLSGERYRIEKPVASGGMGAVYRAIDTRFNRPCAVKEMLDEFQSETERTQAVEWFGREATMLLDLNQPCIPRVRDFFVEGGKHYLVMDFIEGRTLGDILEKEGNVLGVNGARGVTEARARSWGQQICSVLGYLHRQAPPIIFRDLKPSNIMVTERDEVKLIDFGIARTFQAQRQSTIIMTIGYAPPEQLHGMPEPRSDIYALGATLHRILTHHDAANNKPSIFAFPLVRTLRPDISMAFEQVIMRALAPGVEQRWINASEMEKAIINLPPISVVPPTGAIPQLGQARLANPQTPSNSVTPSNPSRHSTTGPGGRYIISALGFINTNRIEEAYAAIQQAYVLEPNNSLVHRTFGQVFARRKPPEIERAMQAYNRSLQLNSNDAETHKLVGDVALFLRRLPLQAIPAYTQSLRLNPNDVESHQRLAQCYEDTNQLEPALREYQEAARFAPKQPLLHQKVGQLAWRLNQFPIAERAFVTVLTLNPADHQTRFLLSQVYENEGKLIDAERECAYVAPMIPAAQQVLLRIRSRLGR